MPSDHDDREQDEDDGGAVGADLRVGAELVVLVLHEEGERLGLARDAAGHDRTAPYSPSARAVVRMTP